MCFCATPSVWDRSPQGPSYLVLRISKGILLAGQRTCSVSSLQDLSCSTHLTSSWMCGYASLSPGQSHWHSRLLCFCLCPTTCCRRNLSPSFQGLVRGVMGLVPFKTDLQRNRDYCPIMPKSLSTQKKSILERNMVMQGPCLGSLGQVYLSCFLFWIFFFFCQFFR